MAKTVRLEPIAQETSVETNGNLLSILDQQRLRRAERMWRTWNVCHLPRLRSKRHGVAVDG